MFKILELSELFVCLEGLVKIFSAWGRDKFLGCGLLGEDQYPGWHYAMLLLCLRLLSIILSQCEALQTKQSTFEMQIADISVWLFCKGQISVNPNNPMLSLAENSRCLYTQYRILLDDAVFQVYVSNGKIELFQGVGVSKSFFLHNTSSTRV